MEFRASSNGGKHYLDKDLAVGSMVGTYFPGTIWRSQAKKDASNSSGIWTGMIWRSLAEKDTSNSSDIWDLGRNDLEESSRERRLQQFQNWGTVER